MSNLRATLRTIRDSRGLSQTDVAKASGIAQGDVAKLETRDDLEADLATLRRYVEALGGTLSVTATFGSCAIAIEPASKHVRATAGFVRELRKQAGVTRAELAARLRMTPEELAAIETGRQELNARVLRKVLQAIAQEG